MKLREIFNWPERAGPVLRRAGMFLALAVLVSAGIAGFAPEKALALGGGAGVEVLSDITITRVKDLNFGTFVVQTSVVDYTLNKNATSFPIPGQGDPDPYDTTGDSGPGSAIWIDHGWYGWYTITGSGEAYTPNVSTNNQVCTNVNLVLLMGANFKKGDGVLPDYLIVGGQLQITNPLAADTYTCGYTVTAAYQ